MSVTTSTSSAIDEQLRLQIAEQLAGTFKGEIIGPDHAEYEEARQVWNAMIDRHPGLILRCTSTADVVAAVNVARPTAWLRRCAAAGTTWPARPCPRAA